MRIIAVSHEGLVAYQSAGVRSCAMTRGRLAENEAVQSAKTGGVDKVLVC